MDKVDKRKMIVHIVHMVMCKPIVHIVHTTWARDLKLTVHIVHMTHGLDVSNH